jgi:hypothetical protein
VEDPVDNRLAELERRIAALESADVTKRGTRRRSSDARQADTTRALRELQARRDWSELAPALAALGSPIRLTLLREIVRGHATVNSLSQLDGLGTSGQIYHHLRHLTAEGWLHTPTRGTFAIPPTRATALNAILTALDS